MPQKCCKDSLFRRDRKAGMDVVQRVIRKGFALVRRLPIEEIEKQTFVLTDRVTTAEGRIIA